MAQLVNNPLAEDLGLICALGRSTGEGNSYPLQYFGLENSKDCIVHGVTKNSECDFPAKAAGSLQAWSHDIFICRASLIAQLVKNLPAMQETRGCFLGQEDLLEKGKGYSLQYSWASLVAQLVKNLPAVQETWV